MTNIELKTCPFCGGEAELYVNGGISARCRKCYCGTTFKEDSYPRLSQNAVERAIEEWNRRVNND